MGDISIRSFDAMHESGGQFMSAANRMEQRLDDLMRRINAMNWDSQSREAFNAIQRRFNGAYTDLRGILHTLGGNVGGIASTSQETESWLANNVWGG